MEGRDLRSIYSFLSTVFFFPGDQMYSRCVEHKDVSETVIRWCHFCPFVPLTFVSQGERMYSFSPLLTARDSAFPSTRLLKRLARLGLLFPSSSSSSFFSFRGVVPQIALALSLPPVVSQSPLSFLLRVCLLCVSFFSPLWSLVALLAVPVQVHV